MPNYLVRTIADREAVGFFAVEDLDDLTFWVDEVTDPSDCEYAEIGSGSVIWEGRAKSIPMPDHDWDMETRPPLDVIGPHDLGGVWMNALFSEDLEFTPCFELAANEA